MGCCAGGSAQPVEKPDQNQMKIQKPSNQNEKDMGSKDANVKQTQNNENDTT